ncbi:hypothetical protein [Streptomyces sp. AC555_RSS877]|uniref:hypothetical protein n=1 Tax=Streptomyces sp. AC555_RSS877 TaxID=2823688 RepID=UPI0020B77210|nr:hypothetical protein [Streptomyces sp. AC555_RSS877]
MSRALATLATLAPGPVLALTAAAPAPDSGGKGWVLAGFATAAALAGVPLYLVARRRRTTASADQIRDCGP